MRNITSLGSSQYRAGKDQFSEDRCQPLRLAHLTERLASLRSRLGELEEIGRQLEISADGQLSLTDPDARAMATATDHRGVVGYNVQAAVDTKHHVVIVNDVTNWGNDRAQLLGMLRGLRSRSDAERHPTLEYPIAMLDLLWATLAEDATLWPYKVEEVLDFLSDASETQGDPRLSELRRRRSG